EKVHFFDEEIVQVAVILANSVIRVIFAGLVSVFRCDPFGSMSKMMLVSEAATEINYICPHCCTLSSRTQLLINGKSPSNNYPIILVSTSESYEPRCRHHHEVTHKTVKTSSV